MQQFDPHFTLVIALGQTENHTRKRTFVFLFLSQVLDGLCLFRHGVHRTLQLKESCIHIKQNLRKT